MRTHHDISQKNPYQTVPLLLTDVLYEDVSFLCSGSNFLLELKPGQKGRLDEDADFFVEDNLLLWQILALRKTLFFSADSHAMSTGRKRGTIQPFSRISAFCSLSRYIIIYMYCFTLRMCCFII